ncbi:DUF1801 domain-containing protein [Hoeflea sp.]|uniref:DUF1801 domain-containing protein n=1 Tax=Hoeflea sp. TaxID=1940281 RepID=UPI0025BC628A|nr:DUF1801 domain-containing protein [Hoeflea sp.]
MMKPTELKTLIHDVAAATPNVGPLAESLIWGEQSFTPVGADIGSSVRIRPRAGGNVALMFICHTGLVEEFRALHSDTLTFEGNRAIVMQAGQPVDRKRCPIASALR